MNKKQIEKFILDLQKEISPKKKVEGRLDGVTFTREGLEELARYCLEDCLEREKRAYQQGFTDGANRAENKGVCDNPIVESEEVE